MRRIYRLSPDHRLTLIAQTNDGEIVRLLSLNNSILAATANIGKIYRLGSTASKGTYESPVFDAGSVGLWGQIRWQGERRGDSNPVRQQFATGQFLERLVERGDRCGGFTE